MVAVDDWSKGGDKGFHRKGSFKGGKGKGKGRKSMSKGGKKGGRRNSTQSFTSVRDRSRSPRGLPRENSKDSIQSEKKDETEQAPQAEDVVMVSDPAGESTVATEDPAKV